jgi:hypothetical protein
MHITSKQTSIRLLGRARFGPAVSRTSFSVVCSPVPKSVLLEAYWQPFSIGIKREKHLVHVYIGVYYPVYKVNTLAEIGFVVVALVMTVLVWKVPSFVGNAFCTAVVGFVLGRELFASHYGWYSPSRAAIFPTSLSLATKVSRILRLLACVTLLIHITYLHSSCQPRST